MRRFKSASLLAGIVGALVNSAPNAFRQAVFTVELVPAEKNVPAQNCVLSTREARGDGKSAPNEDTLRVLVLARDRNRAVTTPTKLNVAAVDGKSAVMDTGRAGVDIVQSGAALRGKDVRITVADGGYEVCKVAIPGTSQSEGSPLVLRFGPEFTSANNFDSKGALSAAIGVRWDIADLRGKSSRVGFLLSAAIDHTTAVAEHEFRSCRRFPYSHALKTYTQSAQYGGCAKADTVVSTSGTATDSAVYDFVQFSDSARATTTAVWRASVTGRVEYEPRALGLRLGMLASVGVQPDPRPSAFGNGVVSLNPYWSVGSGIRKVATDNAELFTLDVAYGTVKNLFEYDRLKPPVPNQPADSARFRTEPTPIADKLQWQAALGVRLFKGASIRAYATFKGPFVKSNRADVSSAQLHFPDAVRIAFLLDRDVKQVFDSVRELVAPKNP